MKPFMNILLDALFPKFCVGCKKEGSYLCAACQPKLQRFELYSCPLCGQGRIPYILCRRCRKKYPFNRIVITHSYRDRKIEKLVTHLKHRFIEEIHEIISQRMTEAIIDAGQNDPVIQRWIESPKTVAIIPVPLHPKRQRQRGFNQSQLIADRLTEHFHWKKLDILNRLRHTKPQTELPRENRLSNLRDAFSLKENVTSLVGYHILLIDDVLTTGATVAECARALENVQPKTVNGLIFSKNV